MGDASPPGPIPVLVLRILPDGPAVRFDGSKPVTIGRDPAADLVVDASAASRRHAVIVPEPGTGWVLMDASRSGTFVNGAKVGRHVLAGASELSLGEAGAAGAVRVQVAVEGAGGVAAAPPAMGSPPQGPALPRPGAAGFGPRPVAPPQNAPQTPPRQPATPQGFGPPAAGAPQHAPHTPPIAQPFPLPPRPGPQAAPPAQPLTPPRPGRLGTLRPAQLSLGQYSRAYQPAALTRIGRAADNDIVVDDLLVSRHHAEVRLHGGRHVIADLGSHNGTFLNGSRLSGRAELAEGAVVAIGHHLFTLSGGRIEEFVDAGAAAFAAVDLTVTVGGKHLLRSLSLCAEAGDFITVLGPTGAGKSTLIRALSGSRPADGGSVLYNGRDIYANFGELRNRIGYVPQDDVLHPQLTVREALRYSAELRFPPDVADGQREHRVSEVIAELGLNGCADTRLAQVSGGQRKRTSIALELLTKPSLIILDEPTSGLDPWYEWTVMELLRGLADGGRTVVAVTHTIESLDLCDRILFLAPGGQAAFFGPPSASLPYFGVPRTKDVFHTLNEAPAGTLAAAFAASPQHAEYVARPLAAVRREIGADGGAGGVGGAAGAGAGRRTAAEASAPQPNPLWRRQLSTLVRRFAAVIRADQRNTLMLFAQAPVLGLLMLAVLPGHTFAAGGARPSKAGTVVLALVLGATYLGASNSIREIVKERPILTRERAVGLSPVAYVVSKAVVLGALTIAQAVVLVVLGTLRQGSSGGGSVIGSVPLELIVVASLSGLAAMSLGLVISALVTNADKALTVLPVVLFAEFLLTGGLFSTQTPVIKELSYLSSAHWGYVAAASTVQLDMIVENGCDGSAPAQPSTVTTSCDAAQAHTAGAWTADTAALGILTAICLIGAVGQVRRVGQPRR